MESEVTGGNAFKDIFGGVTDLVSEPKVFKTGLGFHEPFTRFKLKMFSKAQNFQNEKNLK